MATTIPPRACTQARPCGRPSCRVCDGVGPAHARPADDRPPSEADRRAFYADLDRFLDGANDREGAPTS